MTADPLRYRAYCWRGADEWLVEAGSGPTVLLVPPLFEEMNRCRALMMAIVRKLAEASLHAILPDLPGTGESERDFSDVDWDDWRGAIASLRDDPNDEGQPTVIACFRGGGLLVGDADPCWRFAPVAGAALTRDLVRAKQAVTPDKVPAEIIEAQVRSSPTELAGYILPPRLFASLADAIVPEAARARTVRLLSDPAAADLKLEGKPLWRQSEPGQDYILAEALTADIVAWRLTCAA